MKRTIALLLALLCMLSAFAACGKDSVDPTPSPSNEPDQSQTQTQQPEEQEPDDQQPEEEQPVNVEWADLSAEIGTVAVRLPIQENSYYSWDITISDPNVVEMLNSSSESGQFVVSFRGLSDGECTLQFDYCCADALAETRTLVIKVSEGKIAEIISAKAEEVEGIRTDVFSPELMEFFDANRLEKIFESHDVLTCVSEMWIVEEDGTENWFYKGVEQFSNFDDELQYVCETIGEDGVGNAYSGAYMGGNIKGAFYTFDPASGFVTVSVRPAAEYKEMVCDFWLFRTPGESETIVSIGEDDEYRNRTIITEVVYEDIGICDEYVYFIDMDTGLLTGMEQSSRDIETGKRSAVVRSNILYDSPRELTFDAVEEVFYSDDPFVLNVLFNPGREDLEVLNYAIKKGSLVRIEAYNEFEMFSDEACTQQIYEIDSSKNEVTVFVKYVD